MTAALLAVALTLAAPDTAAARLTRVRGDVAVLRGGETAAAAPGFALAAGDVVRTGPTGRARIAWIDSSTLDLSPRSAARIGASRLRTTTVVLLVGIGRLRVPPREGDAAVRVVTPAATVGVRGTDFTTAVADDGATRTKVRTGEVWMARDDPEDAAAEGGAGAALEAGIGAAPNSADAEATPVAWRRRMDRSLGRRAARVAARAEEEIRRSRREAATDFLRTTSIASRIRGLVAGGAAGEIDVAGAAEALADGLRLWRRATARRQRLGAAREVLDRLRLRGADVAGALAAWEDFRAADRAGDERVETLAVGLERLSAVAARAPSGAAGGILRGIIRGLPLRWGR